MALSALPGDPTFNQYNNHYDVASYKRISGEFGIDSSSDLRFTSGANSGLGVLYVKPLGESPTKTDYKYPGWNKFSDDGGKLIKGTFLSLYGLIFLDIGSSTGLHPMPRMA